MRMTGPQPRQTLAAGGVAVPHRGVEKGGMGMNQKAADQGWQQLQSHIEGFFSRALRSDAQRIEYKPRFIVQLLESPAEREQIELREMGK